MVKKDSIPKKIHIGKDYEFSASTDATMMGGLAKRIAARDMIDQYNLGFGPVTKKAEEADCADAPGKMFMSSSISMNSSDPMKLPETPLPGNNMAEQARLKGNVISGGKADYMPDHKFPSDKLAQGMKVEREHTSNDEIAKEIAKDHLVEDINYYDKLMKVHK